MSPSEKRNVTISAVLCVACLVAVIVFGVVPRRSPLAEPAPQSERAPSAPPPASAAQPQAPRAQSNGPPPAPSLAEAPAKKQPTVKQPSLPPVGQPLASGSALLYFRTNALGPNYGKLAVASFSALDHPHYSEELSCERLYFAAGHGVCLVADRGMFTSFYAVTFDKDL